MNDVTIIKPKRRRNESPVQYYNRTKRMGWPCVDDHFTDRWHGYYYCNPAHCKGRWKSKIQRDLHLDMAYAALG